MHAIEPSNPQRKLSGPAQNLLMKMKIGMLLAIAWGCFLIIAFASYPKPDNLVTGYIVYALYGVDALEKISMATAIAIGIGQIGICFLFGYLVGAAIHILRRTHK